jgi:hypothetical protein
MSLNGRQISFDLPDSPSPASVWLLTLLPTGQGICEDCGVAASEMPGVAFYENTCGAVSLATCEPCTLSNPYVTLLPA